MVPIAIVQISEKYSHHQPQEESLPSEKTFAT